MSYDPTIAEWTTEDPEGYVDGSNLYRFERSNPTSLLDPTGNASIGIVNPGLNDGQGGHAFIIVNTPKGPQVYSFNNPNGWDGPTPFLEYLNGRSPYDNYDIYPLPGVSDKELDDYLKSIIPKRDKWGPQNTCSIASVDALRHVKIPPSLEDLLKIFDGESPRGPTNLAKYMQQYDDEWHVKPTLLHIPGGGVGGGGTSSSGSSGSSSSSSSGSSSSSH